MFTDKNGVAVGRMCFKAKKAMRASGGLLGSPIASTGRGVVHGCVGGRSGVVVEVKVKVLGVLWSSDLQLLIRLK